jgi:cholesterol transport system auxiliary component
VRWVALGMLCGVSAGCSGGFHSSAPASQTYILRITAPAAAAAPAPNAPSLRIDLPLAAPGLQSEHIVIVEPNHRMSHYAASQWAAALPFMVEELALERLRAAGDWSTVFDAGSNFASEYYLQIRIRRFEAEYAQADAPPTVQVVLDCALGRRADHAALASFAASGSAAANANRLSAVVAAFDDAVNAALAEVATGSAQALKNSRSPTSP